ncbi:MAG: LysR substrate-binding domain-containing protein [Alphaproteobacteria bacterium]
MKALSRVHLNGLRALEATGRLGSLQAAADELGVSPGAVSQQVGKSESQLGRAVFRRTPRGLVPTAFGSTVLARLTAGFRELERAVALADIRAEAVLTVSVPPVLAAKWLVWRLAHFRAANPDLQVRIEATTELAALDGSDIDLAIRLGRGGWPGVRAEWLMDQEVFPVCTPELAGKMKTPRGVLSLPALIDANARFGWDLWLAEVGLAGQPMNSGYTFTDAALCLDAAIAGQGLMLAWPTLACDAIARGCLVAPFRERARTGHGYWLVTAGDERESAKVARFKAWVRQEMAETAALFATAVPERPA